MTISSQAEYDDWLVSDTAIPAILVEAEYSAGTEYFASMPFVSGTGDSPANQAFDDLLVGNVVIDDRLDHGQVGDLELVNDGELEPWLTRKWYGYSLKIYLGDQSWPLADFKSYGLVIDGINGGLRSPRSDRVIFAVRDQRENLREVVGSQAAPVCLGKVFNITPVLKDAANRIYKVRDGAVSSIVVRDNGAVLIVTTDYTEDLSNGEFTLVAAPAGQVTVDVVQADQSFEDIVTELCGLLSVSVNATNLAAFPNTAPLGIYVDKETQLDTLLNTLAASVGGVIRINGSGEVEAFRIEEADTTADMTLIEDDFVDRGMSLASIEQPVKKLTLGYQKNWTLQDPATLAGSVSLANRELFATDYSDVTASNTLSGFPLAHEKFVDTLIYASADAQTECDRRRTLRNTTRHIYSVKAFLSAAPVVLGDTLEITYPGYGFESGKKVRLIGISRILGKRRLELTLW